MNTGKPLYFVRHARNRMRWNAITRKEIEDCLRHPEWTETSAMNRTNAWGKWRDRYLRVTCIEEEDRIVIITVVPKEKLPRGG